jgi:peptide subunit release factor 1 (eRF1)
MAEQRLAHLLEGFLHETLKERIISRIYGSPEADPRDRKELIASALRDHRTERETKALEALNDYKPEVLVSGMRDVIEVCDLFLMRKLFANQDLHQPGLVCKEHHYVSLEETECPFCRARLLPVENVVDEIVEIARLHAVDVTIVEYRQDLMAKYDGIAAVIYGMSGRA